MAADMQPDAALLKLKWRKDAKSPSNRRSRGSKTGPAARVGNRRATNAAPVRTHDVDQRPDASSSMLDDEESIVSSTVGHSKRSPTHPATTSASSRAATLPETKLAAEIDIEDQTRPVNNALHSAARAPGTSTTSQSDGRTETQQAPKDQEDSTVVWLCTPIGQEVSSTNGSSVA